MKWIYENKIVIAAFFVIAGFVLLVTAKSEPTNTTAAVKTPFTSIDSSSKMRRGSEQAKVSLIQYSDFLCPSCSYISTQVMPEIDKTYITSGDVQFEFRPMAFIAEGSVQAGMGAFCAIDQSKVWPYHDVIYTYVADRVFNRGLDPKKDTILTADIVKKLAADAGLEETSFNDCLDSKRHFNDITNSTNIANKNGVTGTPYMLVNGKPIGGNPNLQTVDAMIKAAL